MNQSVANPNKALWEKGDFTEIAAFMRQSGEALMSPWPSALRLRFSISAAGMEQQRYRSRRWGRT